MSYFQKTIVRYKRNPRAAKDAPFWEKWICPCFLGTDDKGDTHWYGYTFDDLLSSKKVHEIFYFDSYNLPPKDNEHYYEALRQAKDSIIQAGKDLVMNLMALGLLPKTETFDYGDAHVRPETREYCYVFEGFRFEHNVIKELLGLDVADNKSLTEEQFEQLREKQDARWRKWGDLINGDYGDSFVNFKGLTQLEEYF
jgi:hypothetical protein